MDDIGNIIYLILIIVAGISSAVSKNKKKQKKVRKAQRPIVESQKELLDEIEEQWRQQMERGAVSTESVRKKQESQKSSHEIRQQNLKKVQSQTRTYERVKFNSKKEDSNFELRETDGGVFDADFSNYEEVRNAIICKEIFDRKYI